ncbi:MAG: hypothetical protein M1840_009081 [Geoglossum simile]|nr:MAG: hypothetical protein M1840_009081 [Geoglossum simile]
MPDNDGYEELCEFMAKHPGMSIVRKFYALNIRNILFMQAELTYLIRQWDDTVREDGKLGDNLRYSVHHMKKAGQGGILWPLALQIRSLLKDYNDALLQLSLINKLEGANKVDIDALRKYLRCHLGVGNFFRGGEGLPWSEVNSGDLVDLSSCHGEKDLLTRWISNTLVLWYHKHIFNRFRVCLPRKQTTTDAEHSVNQASTGVNARNPGIYEYDNRKLLALAETASSIISTLLLISAIVVLHNLHSPAAKLGSIVGFTLLFTIALGTTTKCRRIEVFASTAA